MSVDPAPPSAVNGRTPELSHRSRTVLLAEDDDAVREFVRTVLEQVGLVVVAACDGRSASELFASDPGRYDLLLTDVVMPHVVGPELAAHVRKLRPSLPILFMSAFPGGPGVAIDPIPAAERFLQKPFTVTALVQAVNEALSASHV